MRGAVLALAFDGLGAEVAESNAFLDNLASLGREPGARLQLERLRPARAGGRRARDRAVPDDREAWAATPRPAVAIEGLDGCLDLFGRRGGEPNVVKRRLAP